MPIIGDVRLAYILGTCYHEESCQQMTYSSMCHLKCHVIGAENGIINPSSNSCVIFCVHFTLMPLRRHVPISS